MPSQHASRFLRLSSLVALVALIGGCAIRSAAPARRVGVVDTPSERVPAFAPSPSYRGYVTVIDGASGKSTRTPQ
jgi:hypothetical protein